MSIKIVIDYWVDQNVTNVSSDGLVINNLLYIVQYVQGY